MENKPNDENRPIKLDAGYLGELTVNGPVTQIVQDGRKRDVEVHILDFSDMSLRRTIRKNADARIGIEVTFSPDDYKGLKEPLTFVPDEDDVWVATSLGFRVVDPGFTYPQWLFILKTDAYLASNINRALNDLDDLKVDAAKNDSGSETESLPTDCLTNTTADNA